jgi:hypothetical protein
MKISIVEKNNKTYKNVDLFCQHDYGVYHFKNKLSQEEYYLYLYDRNTGFWFSNDKKYIGPYSVKFGSLNDKFEFTKLHDIKLLIEFD